MRITKRIFVKLMSRFIFLSEEVLLFVCLTILLVQLNMGQGDRH